MEPSNEAIPDARGLNLFRADADAARLFSHYLPAALYAHLEPHLDRLGELAGGRLDELASLADRNPPVLHVRARSGQDRETIEKHPAYVEMERLAYGEFGLAALSHTGGVLGWTEPMPPSAKYALTYLFCQAEFGLMCPVSMTDSLTRTLKRYGDPALVARFVDRLTATDFDEAFQGAMFMTEQGAGSDVAATACTAEEEGDGTFRLFGDKWFCSNADADLAMVLARSEPVDGLRGVSLFLLPRLRHDGTRNAYRILRLKEKLGTRAMPSGEIRLEGATAYLVGERGRGFQQMANMINNSRLSNGVRSAAIMRRAVSEALFVASRRRAFGRRLVELPLMRRQLVKMLLAAEQARTLSFLAADALHLANEGDAQGAKLARVLTPLLKFRACRDARRVAGDAMEVRGGCGYVEEWSDARLLRDAHLGSIWEGTSNIVALDVLRAIRREDVLPHLRQEVGRLLGGGEFYARSAAVVERAFAYAERVSTDGTDDEARRAASALYHVVTMAGFVREARNEGLAHRQAMADLVLRHQLLPQDPLNAYHDDDEIETLLAAAIAGMGEPPVIGSSEAPRVAPTKLQRVSA